MKKLATCALALLLTLVLAPIAQAGDAGSWDGWITDPHCGKAGAKAGHEDCALKCIKDGGKLVFYNGADQKIYQIDDQEAAKAHLGHEVTVKGTVDGESITVASIAQKGT